MSDEAKVAIAYLTIIVFWIFANVGIEYIARKISMRKYRKYEEANSMSVDEACKILGIKKKDLKKMSKQDVKKAYWKKAQEVHPDKTGNNDGKDFRNVNNAWDHIQEACYA